LKDKEVYNIKNDDFILALKKLGGKFSIHGNLAADI
jgi:hypothetical protein